MKLDRDTLLLPEAQGVRLVALLELRDARKALRRFDRAADPDHLHQFRVALRRLRSWIRAFRSELRPAVRGKHRRRLRDIARATGRGRDTDVQLAWLNDAAASWRPSRRRGAVWLRNYIVGRQGGSAGPGDPEWGAEFLALGDRLELRLATYEAEVIPRRKRRVRLADAVSRCVGPHVDVLVEALGHVGTVDDETPAHQARIAAKRLRYLIDPFADFTKGGASLVARLKGLQDELGELHDAHVMGHRIRTALAATAATARAPARDALSATLAPAPEDAVLAVAQTLRKGAEDSYQRVHTEWTGRTLRRFIRDAEAFAKRLRKMRG